MTDYTKLDEAILAAIRAGKREFNEIWRACDAEADEAAHHGNGSAYRAVDRRLQSLRKRGLIAYAKGAWSIVQVEA